MRRSAVLLAAIAVLFAAFLAAQGRKTFDIYSIDVEGGASTLYVAPSGESLLIDSGNNSNGRDAERIIAAAKDAGLKQIDHLVTTHFHGDHIGGLPDLADRFPIREFIDHGENVQPPTTEPMISIMRRYAELSAKAKHRSVRPGDKIAIAGIDVLVVASNGEIIPKPLPGAGKPNPECATFERQQETNFEDFHSVGTLTTFGKFRVLLMGDFTVNHEFELMCPNARLGTVDVWIVSNHGQPRSGSAVLAHAIQPRVAIMNNGVRKGGQPEVMRIVRTIPGLEDLWQQHFSLLSGQEYATPGLFIANIVDDQPATVAVAPMPPPQPGGGAPPAPTHNGPAYWIKVSAQPDGVFSVTNSRNGFVKNYKVRTATTIQTR
jgi:competence protein ComEC